MTREPYLIGYARVSKGDDQSNATQRRALDALGCKRVFEETASGGRWDRPKLLEMIGQLREGDVVVVWKLVGTATWMPLTATERVYVPATVVMKT